MPTFTQLTDTLAGDSKAVGYDVIVQIKESVLNRFLYAQYAEAGHAGSNRYMFYKHGTGTGGDYFGVLELGPPLLQVGDQFSLTFSVATGVLAHRPDGSQPPDWAVDFGSVNATITGVIPPQMVTFSDGGGELVLDFKGGTWTAKLDRISPSSQEQQEIVEAIRDCFTATPYTYILCSVKPNADLAKCLTPTAIDFYVDTDAPGEPTVSLLINTTSRPPQSKNKPPYLIPDGHSAALLLSNKLIFCDLLPGYFTAVLKTYGVTFKGEADASGNFMTVVDSGLLDLGVIGSEDDYVVSGSDHREPQPIGLSLGGGSGWCLRLILGSLDVEWERAWTQAWAVNVMQPNEQYRWQEEDIDMTVSVSGTNYSMVRVDPGSNLISTQLETRVTVDAAEKSFWDQFAEGEVNLSGQMTDRIETIIMSALGSLRFPDISVFSLANLLFPGHHALVLKDAAIPCDLLATGDIVATVDIVPRDVTLGAGQTQQYSASKSGASFTQLWMLNPKSGVGSIDDKSGSYTAPKNVPKPAHVVVVAADRNDQQTAGYTTIALQPAPARFTINPAGVSIAPGAALAVQAFATDGSPLTDVTFSASIGQFGGADNAVYTAPSVSKSTKCTIAAKSASLGTASVDWTVLPADTGFAVTADSDRIYSDEQMRLTVHSDVTTSVGWWLTPEFANVDSGWLDCDDDSLIATYNAPEFMPLGESWKVTATAFSKAGGLAIGSVEFTVIGQDDGAAS